MRIMITGATGFIGSYLVKHCVDADNSVLGIGVDEPDEAWAGAAFESCDIRDFEHLSKLVSTFKPHRIFHLAAQSFPTISLIRPRETFDINVGGTMNLLEALRIAGISPIVVVACSSAEYGNVASRNLPVCEDHPLLPLHPYGVSKVAQDLLAAQYFANYSIPAIRIRIFNTTGPGKTGDVCSDLTKRAIEIEQGIQRSPMAVGNVTSRRAIVDVRDMVHALWLSTEHCVAGDVYNVGSERIYSVQDVIELIRANVEVQFSVKKDPALVRGCDEPVIAGDVTKFRSCTGWSTQIELSKTIRDMLDWWRNRSKRVSTLEHVSAS